MKKIPSLILAVLLFMACSISAAEDLLAEEVRNLEERYSLSEGHG